MGVESDQGSGVVWASVLLEHQEVSEAVVLSYYDYMHIKIL